MTRERGELALVLHTHMPYVEGFDTWPFGEEWLFEAVAAVYLPLLDVLEGAPVTLGLTPVLCDQFEALRGEAGERLAHFLSEIRGPIHEEDAHHLDQANEPALAAELRRAAGDYEAALSAFEGMGRDLLGAYAALSGVERWTSSATHAVLPLLATTPGLRLQVGTGVGAHEHRFGAWSGGFWLPECAYEPGLERDLAEHGVTCFCVDQTAALGLGSLDQLEPVRTEGGPLAVPVDWATVSLVWNDQHGYPVNAEYRDYHGRTVHDLRPWNNGGGDYDHARALQLAREHARDFVARVIERLDSYSAERGRPGLVCCALDTELLGHWWYEGIPWLAAVLEEAGSQGLALSTLPDALGRVEPVERPLVASTWGSAKDFSTWDSHVVADFAWSARRAELRTVAAAGAGGKGPALERAARELLLLQASDWAFLTTHDLAADYPRRRLRQHSEACDAALRALADSAPVEEPKVRGLAPSLDLSPLVSP